MARFCRGHGVKSRRFARPETGSWLRNIVSKVLMVLVKMKKVRRVSPGNQRPRPAGQYRARRKKGGVSEGHVDRHGMRQAMQDSGILRRSSQRPSDMPGTAR